MSRRWANRVVGWGEVAPDQLLANPFNARRHPAAQRDALRGSLNELDIIAPVIVNRTTNRLVDGHARVEEFISAGVELVPVAYVELSEAEEKLALLSLDPIGAMAEYDSAQLEELIGEIPDVDSGLSAALDGLVGKSAERQLVCPACGATWQP